jgi:mRNA-degrading endonuclease RelE of RelBE toxin-antitoxin system
VSEADGASWDVVVTARAERSLRRVPERVLPALIEFIYDGLARNPTRRGKPLRGELEGLWSARRGDYRVLYELNDTVRVLYVIRVGHRADAYR